MRDATPEVRALYRRHVRGNSLLRNLGNGRFEDKTLEAHAEMGRWAWSSDALDFDSDGWDDLYIVNGMLTRKADTAGGADLEGFFWRQVVARSPLTRVPGTPYDDAWRAMNQLLIHGSIASRQRNVFLRNDGHGGFDEISGALGLDLDQDGRSFAALDIDRDGDPDLVVMADRQAPQLRIFRNDFETTSASLAVRLARHEEQPRCDRRARDGRDRSPAQDPASCKAGSGFLSQHSKELLIGLGASERIVKLTVSWPSGATQVFTDVPLNTPRSDRRRRVRSRRSRSRRDRQGRRRPQRRSGVGARATWMYEPFPAPDFSLQDAAGRTRSLAALKGKPAIVLLWSSGALPRHARRSRRSSAAQRR